MASIRKSCISRILARVSSLPLILFGFACVISMGSRERTSPLTPQHQKSKTENIEVELNPMQIGGTAWQFQLTVTNNGTIPVFMLTEPGRVNGSTGGYFNLDESCVLVLDISLLLYPPPTFPLAFKHTRGVLNRLPPWSKDTQIISIPFPTYETVPPYRVEPRELDPSKIHSVRANVGILPDEKGIQDLLTGKERIGLYVNGFEVLKRGAFKDKHLYEAQAIVSSPFVKIDSPTGNAPDRLSVEVCPLNPDPLYDRQKILKRLAKILNQC